ncbi:MAG: M15 family metallopeptidase [Eubacteriales bacterium]|jgi:D-alanyl-D-alanine carboxypeptidase|nr:M15 family metallopeptidase [Eubacteriales bacterium]MDD3571479.1 M15 family metallopeptidase [Eubacteriales bacterium]MDD4133952.1 M15 family metallopeptidase [Eubacteriales bacterium]NLO13117.1 M15 family metallopeptidase [Clostridiales bacterium]
MIKRLTMIFLALAVPFGVFGSIPRWTYPIPANLLENRNGNLTLVNRQTPLDSGFEPNNLVSLAGLRSVSGPHSLRKEAAAALQELFTAAQEEGHQLYVKSSYRSFGTQETMYYNRMDKYGRDDGVVAFPGSSDHQTGLGVDVLNLEWANQDGMRPEFGNTPEARWMEANCAEFGFIIRYLPEKQDITGIIYEPWHLRYVGLEVARYIMEKRLSLEEFDQEVKQEILDYEASGGDFFALCAQLNALPPPREMPETDEAGDNEVSIFYKP